MKLRLTRTNRAVVAVVVGLLAAAYVVRLATVMPRYATDLDPIRLGAQLWLQGQNPWARIGPDQVHFWRSYLRYPMPALVIALPFTLVPVVWARAIFVALTSGTMAFAVTRRAWWGLLVVLSASYVQAVEVAQWSPIVLAAITFPWLGFALAAKPTIGLASLAAATDRRKLLIMLGTMLGITLLSFAWWPGWLRPWITAVTGVAEVRALVSFAIGLPLLLAAIKWRRPEARLLFALSVIRQNPALYEGVLLFAIPERPVEAALLCLGSWCQPPLETWLGRDMAMIASMYLPALAMVLTHPNIAPEFRHRSGSVTPIEAG